MSKEFEALGPINQTETESSVPIQELGPDEAVKIDLAQPLKKDRSLRNLIGDEPSLVSIILAGNKPFYIIDAKQEPSDKHRFFVVESSFGQDDNMGFLRIRENHVTAIGRNHHTDRLNYSMTVSRNHFTILHQGDSLTIKSLEPSNKTFISGHLIKADVGRNYIARTSFVEDRLAGHPDFIEKDDMAPYGYYMDRPVLGRASNSVDGGVYLGGSAREAIWVDGDSRTLKQTYDQLVSRIDQMYSNPRNYDSEQILLDVMRDVQVVMPYRDDVAEAISRPFHGDKLVKLSTYVEKQAGVCRHQGLLSAYLIERLINDGYLSGSVGIERNDSETFGGAHAWAAYRPNGSPSANDIVVDPAQYFVGSKARAIKEGRWNYQLPTY